MAEIKRASPSKGPIAMSTNAAQQALVYALSGASVISVLTEPTWFKGSLLDMRLARQAVDTLPHRPAILRKEFILDEYQIDEARLHGADTVLLIVAMLPPHRLKALYAHSVSRGMEPLVEVNNAGEMRTALDLGAKVIGVNNRNLHDFEVDMGTTSRLAEMVREQNVVLCALSGISTPGDVQMYKEQEVGAVLVGEALMRANDTAGFIQELLAWPPAQREEQDVPPILKINGVQSADEAVEIGKLGVGMIGMNLSPQSQNSISLDTAREISKAVRSERAITRPTDPRSPLSHTTIINEPWFAMHARALARTPAVPLLVGIFCDQSLNEILHAVAVAQLDLVQLEGSAPLEWAKFIPVPVIRAFSADRCLAEIAHPGLHKFVLLDCASVQGEPLVTVDEVMKKTEAAKSAWSLPNLALSSLPIILAGVPSATLQEAIRRTKPWAVDGGDEALSDDGLSLDKGKITSLIKAIQSA